MAKKGKPRTKFAVGNAKGFSIFSTKKAALNFKNRSTKPNLKVSKLNGCVLKPMKL